MASDAAVQPVASISQRHGEHKGERSQSLRQTSRMLFSVLVATTVATSLILIEENEADSDKSIIEEVAWFYTRRRQIDTPIDRFLYNWNYWVASTRMSIRFSWLVKPFIGFV